MPTIIIPVSPMFPPTYPYVPTVSLQAAVMDTDPRSEGLYGRDPPRPPCVPVSPRPRDKVFPGVPKGHGVPVSCPVPPSGGGNPRLEVVLRQIHSLKKGECEEPCVSVFPPCFFVPHVLLCSLMCLPVSPCPPRVPHVPLSIPPCPTVRQAMAQELLKAQDRSERLRQNLEQRESPGGDTERAGDTQRGLWGRWVVRRDPEGFVGTEGSGVPGPS